MRRTRSLLPQYLHVSSPSSMGNDDDAKKKKLGLLSLSNNTKFFFSFFVSFLLLASIGLVYFPRFTANSELPDDWQTWTYGRFRQEFECSKYIYKENKRFYTVKDWQIMRDTYIQHVDSSFVFDDQVPPTKGYSLHGKGNPPPYYADQSPGSGRGLFASHIIHKGELVHNGTISDVAFPNATAWRCFIFALPTKEMACDVTEWSWTQPLQKNGPQKLMTSFTISILVNEGDTDEEVNALPESDVSPLFYATREIQKGEEILTTYDTLYSGDWGAAGLG